MTGLSVLTLVKGRLPHLENLVTGLRRSAAPPDELVVVEMGGPPVSAIEAAFPVRVERMAGRGLPLAAARNRAAALACAENLLFLDVDCIPAAGLIGDMSAALDRRDGLICADVRYLGPDDARGAWSEADLIRRGRPHPVRPFPAAGVALERDPGLFWSLAFGVRKSCFESLGGFDETFTGYGGEDTDLGFRARDAGVPLLLMAGPGAFHQHHPIEDPPVRHLDDILANAAVFRAKWGIWPMRGWLDAFERAGLTRLRDDGAWARIR